MNCAKDPPQLCMSGKPADIRAPDKVHIFISIMPISSPNSMFDLLLESSHRDDSNTRSNIGFDEELGLTVSTEVNFYTSYVEL